MFASERVAARLEGALLEGAPTDERELPRELSRLPLLRELPLSLLRLSLRKLLRLGDSLR